MNLRRKLRVNLQALRIALLALGIVLLVLTGAWLRTRAPASAPAAAAAGSAREFARVSRRFARSHNGLSTEDLAARSEERFASLLSPANGARLESDKWKPMILRKCTDDMPRYYAPCLPLAIPTLEYGEEVVYPDFEATLPGYLNATDALKWIEANYGQNILGQTGPNRRVIVDTRQGTLAFVGLRGQNLIFKDVRYMEGSIPASWVDDATHCMGHMHAFGTWSQRASDADASLHDTGGLVVDEAAVYVTPDSERYQHWLDHTSKTLVQSAHLVTNATVLIPGGGLAAKKTIVQDMWGWLAHYDRSQVMPSPGSVKARRMLSSCRVPYVHPYLFLRLQELVLGPDAPRVPLSERKVVLWYTRSNKDPERANAGRMITNEADVLAEIHAFLAQRGMGERLEVHPPAQPPQSQLEYVRWLNRNVAAIIGPHGGGLCNIKWMAADTLVLELQPRDWLNTHFYEESIGHGLNYWIDMLDPLDSYRNMKANIPHILRVLRAELGKPPRRSPVLRHRYDWPAALDATLGADPSEHAYFLSVSGRCCNLPEGDAGWEGLHVLADPKPMASGSVRIGSGKHRTKLSLELDGEV